MSFVVRKAEARGEPCAAGAANRSVPEPEVATKYLRWTGWLNRLGAAILIIPAIPVILFLIFIVRLTSYGPGVYRQKRVGRSGRVFTLYKIRTMMHDAEALTGPVWTAPNDPRITKVGKLLRAIHLDELPQLINVLWGHMALIGPRPERPEFTQYLAREIPGYMNRYVVAPGITGLAQINLPPDADVDSVRRKLVLDLEYLRLADASTDFRILLCTAVRLFGFSGMFVARKVGLLRSPEIPEYMHREASAAGAPSTYRVTFVNEPHSLPGANGTCQAPLPHKDGVSTA